MMAYPVPDNEFMRRLGEALATLYNAMMSHGIPPEMAEALTYHWYDDFNDRMEMQHEKASAQ